MKIFTLKITHLVLGVCIIIGICGIMIVSIGGFVQTNTTPATNKIVILDARSRSSRGWYLLNLLFKNVDFASV